MKSPFHGSRPVLYLIDGNAYVHRAFHALPPLTTATGLPINAAYGFVRMLLKLMRQYRPEYLAVCFDSPKPTFRHERYPAYKATRKAMEDDLRVQIPIVQELVDSAGIPRIMRDGFEADDLIACLATDAVRQGFDVVVVSGDKDVLQLVDEHVVVYNESRNAWMDAGAVRAKYGLDPGQLVDYFALTGDASDNVPGVRGIGEKTARALLQQHHSLDRLYRNIEHVAGNAGRLLAAQRENAELSRDLVTLRRDIPGVECLEREAFHCERFRRTELITCLLKYDMRGLVGELRSEERQSLSPGAGTEDGPHRDADAMTGDLFAPVRETRVIPSSGLSENMLIANESVVRSFAGVGRPSVTGTILFDEERVVFGCVLERNDAGEPRSIYIPLVPHVDESGAKVPPVPRDCVLSCLEGILRRGSLVTHDLKTQLSILGERELCVGAAACIREGRCEDLMLAGYALNPAGREYTLSALVQEHLGDRPVMEPRVSRHAVFTEYPVRRIAQKALETLHRMRELREVLSERLREAGLVTVYREVDMPAIPPTASMEIEGMMLDRDALAGARADIEARISAIRGEVYAQAGEEFNLNSPRQLAHILFEKLGLPAAKKKKTGYSTDEEVLERLHDAHPVVPLVLEYREMEKLLRSYLDPLGRMVSEVDGRVHTTFNLAATATGRLSSENPNLQNIPVRTAYGRRIRALFRAAPGHLLLAADYSQIELRVLAHISGDEHLRRSFRAGEDVHAATAMEVFGVERDAVTPDMRRAAKVINFGIIYGMSAQGLARELNIPVGTAQEYISSYFARYAGVKAWIDRVIAETRQTGMAVTMFGRRRPVPEVSSPNKAMQSFGERLAVNTPIQGTAADIIKRAMRAVWDYCTADAGHGRLLLQIHDELILEVGETSAEVVRNEVAGIMERETVLDVPIVVDTHLSRCWEKA
jgi:DNA polymerase-1